MRLALLVVSCLVLAPMLAVAPAAAEKPGSCRPGNVFQNEEIRVWFHGSKGMLKVFDTNGTEDDGDHYTYTTGEVVEIGDANETLARMDLGHAFPQTSGCTLEETPEWVNMTFTVTGAVHGEGALGEATVVIAWHFNKTSHGAKFDLDVASWPWQGADSDLAYAFGVATTSGAVEPAENGVGFRDDDGASDGYIEWAPNATATYADGHQETALVDSETVLSQSGHAADVTLRFTNVTAGYDLLEYDPWVGVGEYVIVGGILVGLAPVEQLLPRGVLGALRAVL